MSYLPQADKSPLEFNFINTDSSLFNGGTGDWQTYADAAGAQPVDGTGGSPAVTITRSASVPLKSPASIVFQKDTPGGSSNRQGQGMSISFITDPAFRGKVLRVDFDHTLTTGTYTTGDMAVYLVDITNGTVIQPVGYQIEKTIAGGVAAHHTATFQTSSTGSSYRLCLHVATTSTSDYSIRMDNFSISSQPVVTGVPSSDWTSYTPTWASSGTQPTVGNGSLAGRWRRVGDTMEIDISLQPGSTTTFGTGVYTMSLPSGSSIDTAKLSGGATGELTTFGIWWSTDAGVINYQAGHVFYSSTTSVQFYVGAATATTSAPWTATNPFTLGNGDRFTTRFTVPITGWSSNVQMSSDTETRVVAARYTTATAQSIPDSAFTIIDFNTKDYDTHSAVTTGASWKYTAQVPGKYQISGTCNTAGNSIGTGQWVLGIFKNGSELSRIGSVGINNGNMSLAGSGTVDMLVGDFVDIRLFQSNGASRVLNAAAALNWISIERISGPTAIAANETVAAYAYNTAGTSFTGGGGEIDIPFATEGFDTHGAFSTPTFTAPVSGIYSIDVSLHTNAATLSTTQSMILLAYHNATAHQLDQSYGNGSNVSQTVQGTKLIRMLAGDTLKCTLETSVTVSLSAVAHRNFISIARVGNY